MGYRKFRLSVPRKNKERKKKSKISLTLSIPLDQVSLSCLDSDRKKCNRTQPCSSSKSSQPDTIFVVSLPLPPEKQQITSISPDSPGLNSAVVSKPHQQQSFTTITDFHLPARLFQMGGLTSQGEVKRWSHFQNYSTTQENQLNPATPFRSIQILPGMFMSWPPGPKKPMQSPFRHSGEATM